MALLGYAGTIDNSSEVEIAEGIYFEIGPEQNIIDNTAFTDIGNYFTDTENEVITESAAQTESEIVTEAVTENVIDTVQALDVPTAVTSAATASQTQATEALSGIVIEPNSTANKSGSISVTIPKEEETEGNLVWVPTKGGKKYHSKPSCSGMDEPMHVSLETAIANGYTGCKRCH